MPGIYAPARRLSSFSPHFSHISAAARPRHIRRQRHIARQCHIKSARQPGRQFPDRKNAVPAPSRNTALNTILHNVRN
jgi:hypothetical protein